MYNIDEIKTRKDIFILDVRDLIRERGIVCYKDISEKYRGYNEPSMLKRLKGFNINEKEFIQCISCEDIIRTQFSTKADVKIGTKESRDMWYYDPHRENHLIEEISGIGPE